MIVEQRRELYEVKTELEEEKGKNLKLTAQINRDYENSSKPSSQSPNHKKISNSREKSGRRPGGHLGHKGHAGIKDTPVDLNQSAIFIHDHDTTFYNYGSGHQECTAHILRYCKDSIQNELDRK